MMIRERAAGSSSDSYQPLGRCQLGRIYVALGAVASMQKYCSVGMESHAHLFESPRIYDALAPCIATWLQFETYLNNYIQTRYPKSTAVFS